MTQPSEEDIYALAMSELTSGNPRPGLWAKAFAESDGDENKTKALYIRLRVQAEKNSVKTDLPQSNPQDPNIEPPSDLRQTIPEETPGKPLSTAQVLALIPEETSSNAATQNEKERPQDDPKGWGVWLVDLLPSLSVMFLLLGVLSVIYMPSDKAYTQDNPFSGLLGEWKKPILTIIVLLLLWFAYWVKPRGGSGHPGLAWKRLLARAVDFNVVWIIASLMVLALFAIIRKNTGADIDVPSWGFFAAFFIVWLLYDAILLKDFKTTIGKKLFGVGISEASGCDQIYIGRAFLMLIFGMGLFLPFISLFAYAFSYKAFREKNTTLWDIDRYEVFDLKVGFGRIVFGIVAITILSIVSVNVGNLAVGKMIRQISFKQTESSYTPSYQYDKDRYYKSE